MMAAVTQTMCELADAVMIAKATALADCRAMSDNGLVQRLKILLAAKRALPDGDTSDVPRQFRYALYAYLERFEPAAAAKMAVPE